MTAAPAGGRRLGRALLACAVSALLVAAIASLVDPEAAGERLRAADGRWIAAAFGLSALMFAARALRFFAITTRTGLADVAAATAVQVAANRLAPLRLGELSLPWLLHRASGEPPVPVVVNLLLIRLLELWIVLVAAALAAGAWFGAGDGGRAWMIAAAGLALGLSLFAFRRLVRAGVAAGRFVTRHTPLGRLAAIPRVLGQIDAAVADEARLGRGRRAAIFGCSVAVMALNYAVFGALLAALGYALDPRQIVVGVTASQLAGVVPAPSVGSVGTHETGWTAGFVWVGMALPDAVLTGLFTQVVTLAFAVAFAAPAALRIVRRPPDR